MKYTVRYLDWSGSIKTDTLTVSETTFADGTPGFYAHNLLTLGAGKPGRDHDNAIARLVLDHAKQLLNFTPDLSEPSEPVEPEIKSQTIGTIEKGIDGRDEYILLTRADDDLDADFAHDWLLPQVYRESMRPGGYFCTSVTVTPMPSGNQCIAIVHHRYDV